MGAGASATFPLWAWLVFAGVVLALLFLNLFVFPQEAREVPFKEALWLSALWIAVYLAFGGGVRYLARAEGAGAYLVAYLLEKSLSLDSVFVFTVVFTSFAVPREYRYHVLFYGVLGAIVLRPADHLRGAARPGEGAREGPRTQGLGHRGFNSARAAGGGHPA